MIKITLISLPIYFFVIESVVPLNQNPPRISATKCIEYSKYVYENVTHVNLNTEADENYDEEVETPAQIFQESVCGYTSVELIIGGIKANKREFPHQALIGYTLSKSFYEYYCGGSLISEKYIISAAHCSYHSELKAAKYALLGDVSRHGILDHTYKFEIVERIKHPLYNARSIDNDIMLFKINNALQLGIYKGYIRPACLPQTDIDFKSAPEIKVIASGFGSTGLKLSENLQKVTLKIYEQQKCSQVYDGDKKVNSGIDKKSKICAGSPDKDTCLGDSGTGLLVYNTDKGVDCMYTIVGITSFGLQNCGVAPAVYTKVFNYLDWIESIVWKS